MIDKGFKVREFYNLYRYDLKRKEYYCVKLSQIDYMMYKIEHGELLLTQTNYYNSYNLEELRELLCKKLTEYADIDNYRSGYYFKIKSYKTK